MMDEKNRKEASYIRSLSSEDAATFLIEQYGNGWPVTMTHRSWRKADQIRLARVFIQGRVHATGRGYKDFLSFMSIDAFLKVVEEGLPRVAPDQIDLLSCSVFAQCCKNKQSNCTI